MFLQAAFPVFAKFYSLSKAELQQAYRMSFNYLLLFGFPLCIGTIVTADKVIAFIYGPGFDNSAMSLRIMAFLFLWMFGFANGALLNATGGQNFLAAIMGLGAVLNVIVALILIPHFSFIGASIAAIVSGLVFSFPVTRKCHIRLGLRLPYSLVIKTLISSVVMGFVIALCLKVPINLFIVIFIIAPLVYGVFLSIFRAIGYKDLLILINLFRWRSDLLSTYKVPIDG